MRKLIALFITIFLLGVNVKAQDPVPGDGFTITPDSLHLYFHGCSPHGDFVFITNNTSESQVINRFYSDLFRVECLYEGINISEVGIIVPPNYTLELHIYATPLVKDESDTHGNLYIDTDLGIYAIRLFYENYLGTEDHLTMFSLYPNPANDHITLQGEKLSTISIFNVLGQKVDEFIADSERIVISTASYANGVYLVKNSQGVTKHFIVSH